MQRMLVKVGLSMLVLAGCSDNDGPFDFIVNDRSNELLKIHYDSYADNIGVTQVVTTGGIEMIVTIGACQSYSCVGHLLDETLTIDGDGANGLRRVGLDCTGSDGYIGGGVDAQVSGACTLDDI